MPIIQQQDPFTAALGAVAGYLVQKQQNSNDASDRALKERQVNADIANATANRQLAQRGFELDERNQGIDPSTGQPFQYSVGENELSSPKSSLEHKAAVADQLAAEAAGKGAMVPAQRYTQIATALRTQAHQASQDALDFRKEIDAEITHRAQREHWSEQDRLRAQQVANQYEIGIRNGDIHLQAAQIAASAHLQGISMEQSGAMDRAHYTQGQENSRNNARIHASAANAALQFNTRTKNDASKFNIVHENSGVKYTPQLLPSGGSHGARQYSVSKSGKKIYSDDGGATWHYAQP